MLRKLLLLLLLASPLSAQVVTDIYVYEVKASDNITIKDGENPYADVIITFDTTKFWYVIMTLTKGNAVFVDVQDFEWKENGELPIKNFGIESILTNVNKEGVHEITIKTVSTSHNIDFQSGNNLVIRFFKKSKPEISFTQTPTRGINSFPASVTFECRDLGKKLSDTLEYRFLVKTPKKVSLINGYQPGSWNPWIQGDSGSVVFDSLPCPGKYSVMIQSRNKNTGVESKKIEAKFKYNK